MRHLQALAGEGQPDDRHRKYSGEDKPGDGGPDTRKDEPDHVADCLHTRAPRMTGVLADRMLRR